MNKYFFPMTQFLFHSFNFSYIRLFIKDASGMKKPSLRGEAVFKLLLLLHLLHFALVALYSMSNT